MGVGSNGHWIQQWWLKLQRLFDLNNSSTVGEWDCGLREKIKWVNEHVRSNMMDVGTNAHWFQHCTFACIGSNGTAGVSSPFGGSQNVVVLPSCFYLSLISSSSTVLYCTVQYSNTTSFRVLLIFLASRFSFGWDFFFVWMSCTVQTVVMYNNEYAVHILSSTYSTGCPTEYGTPGSWEFLYSTVLYDFSKFRSTVRCYSTVLYVRFSGTVQYCILKTVLYTREAHMKSGKGYSKKSNSSNSLSDSFRCDRFLVGSGGLQLTIMPCMTHDTPQNNTHYLFYYLSSLCESQCKRKFIGNNREERRGPFERIETQFFRNNWRRRLRLQLVPRLLASKQQRERERERERDKRRQQTETREAAAPAKKASFAFSQRRPQPPPQPSRGTADTAAATGEIRHYRLDEERERENFTDREQREREGGNLAAPQATQDPSKRLAPPKPQRTPE